MQSFQKQKKYLVKAATLDRLALIDTVDGTVLPFITTRVSSNSCDLENPIVEIECVFGKPKIPLEVEKILRSGNRTIVFWADGEKTIVKLPDNATDDRDSIYTAFTAALAKRVYGNNSTVNRIVERKTWIQECGVTYNKYEVEKKNGKKTDK